jgi:MFS family permease
VLPLGLGAIISYFGISKGEAGLLTTVTLVVSALGGALAGILADRIGRVRTLQLTVATYTVFTVLCGFAPNFETLLVLRALQGLGFGVEWAAGAILVAEYAKPRYRGRAVAFAQSAWAVGWGLSVVVYTIVFSFASPDIAWRLLFWTGVIPAGAGDLDPAVCPGRRHHDLRERTSSRGSFAAIFRGDLVRTTLFASLLATGVQGGYYTLATWLPTYLKASRGLTVVGTGGDLAFLITGAFIGYVSGRYLTDLLGRKKTFLPFSMLSARFDRRAHADPARRQRARPGPRVPPRLLDVGDLQRVRRLSRRAVSDRAARHRAGLHLQLRPRCRRGVPRGGGLSRGPSARWSSGPSATGWRRSRCSDCPKPAAAN